MTQSTPGARGAAVATLVALVLVLGGGTTYAVQKVHLPKNSVASKQVKNRSLLGKDLKDGTVTGADVGDGSLSGADVGDGSLSGADLAAGSVTRQDLAHGAVREAQVVLVTDDAAVVGGTSVLDDPKIGTLTFTCGGPSNVTMSFSVPATATPSYAYVLVSDMSDGLPTGSVSASQTVAGLGGGGGSTGGASNGFPEGTAFFDTATKRVRLDWDASTGPVCTLRGTLVIQDKPVQSPVSSRHGSGTRATGPRAVCTVVGSGSCRRG